jgi:hypothetical protein
MKPSSFLAIGFGTLAVWTFCECLLIHYLSDWAQHVGFPVASLGGDLADGHAGLPRDVQGFKVRRLNREYYLVRACEWGEGSSADASLADLAIAVVRSDGRRWRIDARLSVGFVLFFIAACGMSMWIVMTEPLSVLGRVGVIAWSASVVVGLFLLRRRTRQMFTSFAEKSLGSNGV